MTSTRELAPLSTRAAWRAANVRDARRRRRRSQHVAILLWALDVFAVVGALAGGVQALAVLWL